MNDEEEGAMEVMQESHPALIEEREPPEIKPRIEQVERGKQFQALEAASPVLLEVVKTDEREEGREVGGSSLLVESRGQVIVSAEVSVVDDAFVVRNGVEGEDEASLVTAAEKEDGLIGGVEDSVAAEIGRRDTSIAVEEDGKFGGGGEAQTTNKQDDESDVVEETAKVGEMDEVDGSELIGDASLTVALQDCETMEEGNTEDLDTGSKVVKESEIELKEETEEIELGKKRDVKMEARQAVAEEKEMETEKVDGGEEGREVDDSSSPVARSGEDIVVVEDSLVKDEPNLESEGVREEEVLPVTVAVKEDELIAGVYDVIAIQKDASGEEENFDGDRESLTDKKPNDVVETAKVDEKMGGDKKMEEIDGSQLNADGLLPVNWQDNKMVEGGKTQTLGAEIKVVKDSELVLKEDAEEVEVEEKKEIKMEEGRAEAEVEVNEASPIGETATEENQVHVGIELGEDKEAPMVKELCPFGEEEKLDGDKKAQMDMKQAVESNVGGQIAKLDEKMCGDREMEEIDCSQLNADGLFPVTLLDDEMGEDGKTQALGTEVNTGKESEVDLKEESGGMQEVKMEVEEERQREAKEEDKDMDGGVEKETKDEEREDEKEETPKSGSGKQKRGRNSKFAGRAPPRKTVGEDVCFICLDGGDLVLCDRRACPKAYHPSCVDHDEAFFRSKGRWECGWHLCTLCKKNAHYMCYMCQFSLCKGCLTDDASFFCVRGSKGLCQTCMKTVMLIENNEGNVEMAAFDDTNSLDYLFKDYWTEQKEKLSFKSDEIAMLINRWKRFNAADHDLEMLAEAHADGPERKRPKKQTSSLTVEVDYDADGSAGKAEATGARKRARRRLKSQSEGTDPNTFKNDLGNVLRRKKAKKLSEAHAFEVDSTNECTSSQSNTEWASKELLEFVAHVKNGDNSALSQFDVQELILEHVKSNKLRDPRRTSEIVCDAMLQKLFGKSRVGHIEMLKLLESHFLSKEDSQGDDHEGSVHDAEISQLGTDENTDSYMDVGKSRGRKARKRGDSRGLQSNLDDYAAIDMHNIKLIYLRRKLIEALMEDRERFYEKVVGSFVRIRIAGSSQKEIHRLVQVIGTPEAAEPYIVGKRTAYCMLEILNLNKTEVISIDTVSNQDFDEDECKRLRQSIKCGFLSRLTVGDVLDKARDLQVVRVNDWLETEITRLNHLRDRASDLGRKKQLRECVEKLQLLNAPEERQRRLDENPEVHADPNMDPSHESEDESEPEKGREPDIWRRETWREREQFSSRKGDSPSTDPWSSASKSPSKKWEPSRSFSGKGFSSRPGDAVVVTEEALSVKPWSPVNDKILSHSTSLEKLRTPSDILTGNHGQVSERRTSRSPSETSRPPPASSVVQNEVKISETEKLWHYKDPSGKVQGPFSVVQLRKWNKNGYFPVSLRIWKSSQSENDSILLSEALAGRFQKEPTTQAAVAKPVEIAPSQQVHRGQVISTLKIDQYRNTDQLSPTMQQRSQADLRFSSNNNSQDRTPTSSQSISPGSTGRMRASRWSGSPTPAQLPSPTPDSSSQLSRSSIYERKGSFDRSDLSLQSSREAVNLSRSSSSRDDHERLGSAYTAQNPSSQSTHHTLQSVVTETAANVSTNTSVVQNPAAASAHGWSVLNQNLINPNAMHTQGQQQQQQQQQQQPVYSHWQNTPANNLPPPPPYNNTAGQTMSSATFPAQNLSALPSQAAPWTMSQVPTVQPTTQFPGNPAGWAQMQQQQAYLNMGWGIAPTGPSPAVAQQFGPQQPGGTVAGQAPGMQPGNVNPAGWVLSAPAANPAVAGSWNWQPPQIQGQGQGQGMVAPAGTWIPKGQKPCPYLMQGHCKKGASCDFRHN